MATSKLLSWEEIKPFAEDIFDNYQFEIYWAQAAWDLLLKNKEKLKRGTTTDNEKIESILWLFALYSLMFRFKWANGLENSDTEYEFDQRIFDWGMEKEFGENFFDDCDKRAKKYEKFIKDHFNNDLEQINAFFDGDYYIEHYTDYDKERGNNDEEYDTEYNKYRCNMKTEWLHTSFLDNF